VTGPRDIIALVEAPDVPQLGELVSNKIQTAAGASTLTCVVVRLVGDSLRC
jgi:DNA-binding Lrp family transcriptional regulator